MNPIDLIVTVCAVLSPATCEEMHLAFSGGGSLRQCVMGARRLTLHSGWASIRNGTRCGGAANIRTAKTRQMLAEQRPQADAMSGPATLFIYLQSFKSLSAIENTASALISISRTMHCFEFR